MAVLMRMTMPEGVPAEMLDAVTEEMGVINDPPDGLIVHVHYERDGRTEVVDVWESASAFETFSAERLTPAMTKVAEQRGAPAPQPGGADPELIEVSGVVRGR